MRITGRMGVAVACSFLLVVGTAVFGAPEEGWVDLSALSAWKEPAEGWSAAKSVGVDPENPKRLTFEPGESPSGLILVNGREGKARNLVSKEVFGDVEVRLEFLMPKGSNSGIKFQEVYEVQLFDSWGAKTLKGSDSGGVYPRSEEKPKYHHIDGGHPPRVNASKPPGEWQTLQVTFLAPRFSHRDGAKVASARITAVLNGQVVQDNLEVTTPTGSAWKNPEKPTGALLLQADHGPVAFRKVEARRLGPAR
jgi:hypothetical protein